MTFSDKNLNWTKSTKKKMKIKPIGEFEFPANLNSILTDEEYWEDESFDPITITVEEIQYRGEDMISYQAELRWSKDSHKLSMSSSSEHMREKHVHLAHSNHLFTK